MYIYEALSIVEKSYTEFKLTVIVVTSTGTENLILEGKCDRAPGQKIIQ